MKNYALAVIVSFAALLVACSPVVQDKMQDEIMENNGMEEKEMGSMIDEMQKDGSMMEDEVLIEEKDIGMMVDEMHKDDSMMEKEDSMSGPKVIAGKAAKYYELDVAAMENAINEGKIVVLHFHANWCPKCKEWAQKLFDTYEGWSNEEVVGFEVHYKDDQTTSEHENLARKYGIASQGTTVVLKDGQVIFKSPAYVSGSELVNSAEKV